MKLTADRLCKAYNGRTVLKNVSFSVQSGETLAIVGRSGCGKTTLLRTLAGLQQPDSGSVLVDGCPTQAPSKDRLMVFQGFEQLFPWFTLLGNIRYALRKARPNLSAWENRLIAERCLAEMGLTDASGHYPYQLSGGMKQRGALARAMAVAPRALLLDEPFSSLDACTRERVRASFETLAQATGAAVVLVTHDLDEATRYANRIAVLHTGAENGMVEVENRGAHVTDSLRCLLAD